MGPVIQACLFSSSLQGLLFLSPLRVGSRAEIGGVRESGATPAAEILALEICRPLSNIVHPYPPTLHGVFA